jgi:hypothetical protein
MKKYIQPSLMSILALIVCGACGEEQVTTQVESQLIKPYFQLLTQEKYKEAYTIFTSDFYKIHSTFEVYSDSYKKNKVKRGELKHFSIHNIDLSYNLFGKERVFIQLCHLKDFSNFK